MRPYLLLTPGPLTTSETVKEAMMSDWCTWDEDYNVGIVEQRIARRIIRAFYPFRRRYAAVFSRRCHDPKNIFAVKIF